MRGLAYFFLDIRLCELKFPHVYNKNAILSMRCIFQHHRNGLEGYGHRNQATFALFSESRHLHMVFCEVA